jgi:pyruvate dehydrogenase E2 component (dihydrolipoamide acetyltransferase)
MSVSVRMPQLGESVTEGTVTRWLKKEGDLVNADEPLLEVSTDKVDTEIPSPASGVLRGIAVGEEETVEVGAELAVIDEQGTQPADAGSSGAASVDAQPVDAQPVDAQPAHGQPPEGQSSDGQPAAPSAPQPRQEQYPRPTAVPPLADAPAAQRPPEVAHQDQAQSAQGSPADTPPTAWPAHEAPAGGARTGEAAEPAAVDSQAGAPSWATAAEAPPAARSGPTTAPPARPVAEQQYAPPTPLPGAGEGPYITPLVRKLAAEHGVDLGSVEGTGVGGRIRKQDVVEAARAKRGPQPAGPASTSGAVSAHAAPEPASATPPAGTGRPAGPVPTGPVPTAPAAGQPAAEQPPAQEPAAQEPAAQQPAAQQPGGAAPTAGAPAATAAPAAPVTASGARPAVEPSPLRGTTERMSRLRQVIAQRMVDSLHTSAQLTTVIEADVTKIARLRERAKADFEKREGVKLTFLPFFALAALEALKMHPKLNALIDTERGEVTYYDVEHLGIAVDTERGLLVPVIRNAGDLNIGGLARKIDDLARRTRSGQVSPDELSGGTFTLTNTGSRGAIFDTPIINQPQVAILGTGAVVKRPVVLEDPDLGEVIAVRSIVYLALTYDHRLVDGADAARFLATVQVRLEEGTFEAELGL